MRTKSFFDFLPPPQFLSMPHVGLSISDSCVRCIEIREVAGQLTVGMYAEKQLPPDVVRDGYVYNKDILVKVLVDMKKEYGLGFVKVALPEEKAYLFKTEIPPVAEHEIRSTLEFKIEENVPLSATEAVFDYNIIPSRVKKSDQYEVLVSVLPAKVASIYADVLMTAGLTPLSFEIISHAVTASVVPLGDTRTYLVIHIEKSKMGLYLVHNNLVYVTSTSNIDDESFSSSPLVFSYDATNPNLSIKKGGRQSKNGKSSRVDMFTTEIKRVYDYWSTQTDGGEAKDSQIARMILCGESARSIDSIKDSLAVNFSTPVEYANVWSNICSLDEYIPPLSFDVSLGFAGIVSLALPREY